MLASGATRTCCGAATSRSRNSTQAEEVVSRSTPDPDWTPTEAVATAPRLALGLEGRLQRRSLLLLLGQVVHHHRQATGVRRPGRNARCAACLRRVRRPRSSRSGTSRPMTLRQLGGEAPPGRGPDHACAPRVQNRGRTRNRRPWSASRCRTGSAIPCRRTPLLRRTTCAATPPSAPGAGPAPRRRN